MSQDREKERRGEAGRQKETDLMVTRLGIFQVTRAQHKIKPPSYTSREIESEVVFFIWRLSSTQNKRLKLQQTCICQWLTSSRIHSSERRFRKRSCSNSPVVCGAAVVRRNRSSGVRVLRRVSWIVLRQADRQLVAPVACAFHWGHCKQDKKGKKKKTRTLSSCREYNSGVIVVVQNTIWTSPLQNKQCPLTWCMLLQYTASSHGVTRSFMMQTCTLALLFACFLLA